jgi:hypothetical protein
LDFFFDYKDIVVVVEVAAAVVVVVDYKGVVSVVVAIVDS